MPAADRTTGPAREPKTICIPCSQQEYERIADDPARFREFLDRLIEATPELFPPEIHRGYRMKDAYTSRKTGWKLRRIDLRNDEGRASLDKLIEAWRIEHPYLGFTRLVVGDCAGGEGDIRVAQP